MRQLSLGLIIVAMLTNCSEKKKLTLSDELKNLSPAPESFNIRHDRKDSIVTSNGTKIIIPAGAFVLSDGTDVQESIDFEVEEVFDKSDMVLKGIGTTSDDRLLESFGMIKLTARVNETSLKIKDGVALTVSIPNKKGGVNGELFYGEEGGSTLNWDYAGATKDTIEIKETMVPMSNERISVKRTTYRVVDGLREFVSDTVFQMTYGDIANDADSACCWDTATGIPPAYEFQITKLGWINCDRFIDVKDKSDLEIALKNYSQPEAFLVFADINSVMPVTFDEKGTTVAEELPTNHVIDLIVIDKIKDKFHWAKQKVTIKKGNKLVIETQEIDEGQLKAELKALDN